MKLVGRLWFLQLLVLLGFSLSATLVLAAVTGNCVNCHTMHNSQDGTAVAMDSAGVTTAQVNLLTQDCLGCHSATGSDSTVPIGSDIVPIVYNVAPPTAPLAGGNFHWVATNDNRGHNVYGLPGGFDDELTVAPGGVVASCRDCHSTLNTPQSGCIGCHFAAHHSSGTSTPNLADEEDGWYRFLGNPMLAQMTWTGFTRLDREVALSYQGVVGVEEPNWEESGDGHNVYKGTTKAYPSSQTQVGGFGDLANNSIGAFCSGCHSNFHHKLPANNADGGLVSAAGAWIRHPSDVAMPTDGEYAAYSYTKLAPVAFESISGLGTTDDPTVTSNAVVTCISCHRAHGSEFPDMLRWDYQNDCQTGVPGSVEKPCGCFACHTGKD